MVKIIIFYFNHLKHISVVQPLWRPIWSFLKKLKIELPYDLAIRLLDIYPENTEANMQKGICTPMFIVALFTIVKTWKQWKCPSIDVWIKKMQYV